MRQNHILRNTKHMMKLMTLMKLNFFRPKMEPWAQNPVFQIFRIYGTFGIGSFPYVQINLAIINWFFWGGKFCSYLKINQKFERIWNAGP